MRTKLTKQKLQAERFACINKYSASSRALSSNRIYNNTNKCFVATSSTNWAMWILPQDFAITQLPHSRPRIPLGYFFLWLLLDQFYPNHVSLNNRFCWFHIKKTLELTLYTCLLIDLTPSSPMSLQSHFIPREGPPHPPSPLQFPGMSSTMGITPPHHSTLNIMYIRKYS